VDATPERLADFLAAQPDSIVRHDTLGGTTEEVPVTKQVNLPVRKCKSFLTSARYLRAPKGHLIFSQDAETSEALAKNSGQKVFRGPKAGRAALPEKS
jgi:hypothetical protein